jgi:hypothetical protein
MADPTNVVSFPGTGAPEQDIVREMADYARQRVIDLAKLGVDNGQGEPAALVVVVMTKGAGIALQGSFVAGPEEGLSALYVSHAGAVLLRTSTDPAD